MYREYLPNCLTIVAFFLLLCYLIIWIIHLIAIFYGAYTFMRKKEKPGFERLYNFPGVTILKPLKGVDANLHENLETYFHIDYPCYELLFCVQEENDPAVDLVQNLISKYPLVDAKLYSGGKRVCINPKINNLMQCYADIKYDMVLISDSRIKTTNDALSDMVRLMMTGNNVGVVHQMPYCCDMSGFSGQFEKVFFGTFSKNFMFINFVGLNFIYGMSCLFRKHVIDECGGLIHFGQYMSEDYFIAKAFYDKKYQTRISHQVAWQNTSNHSFSVINARVIRWTQLSLRYNILAWVAPLTDCFCVGLWAALGIYLYVGSKYIIFFIAHVLIWYISDYIKIQIIEATQLRQGENIIKCLPAWFCREVICYYWFLRGVFGWTVKWGNDTYELEFGGTAALKETKRRSWSSGKEKGDKHEQGLMI